MIMNYYRALNRSQLQFDFLTMRSGKHAYDEEIKSLGGRIYCIPAPTPLRLISHVIDVVRIIRRHGPYVAVHSHTLHHCGLIMLAARLAGVPVRVSHAHSTSNRGAHQLLRQIYFFAMRALILHFGNRMVACGKEAGRYLFGERALRSKQIIFLPNAIDLEPYEQLDTTDSMTFRQQLGIPKDSFVIGHVGRFCHLKNQSFLISVLPEIISLRKNTYLILVGEGELRPQIEEEVARIGLAQHTLFLGVRSDVPRLMRLFDVFVLPSLYEGLPMVLIEAQAAGTPCVVSSSITREVDMGLGLVHYMDLARGPKAWASAILKVAGLKPPDRAVIISRLRERGYDVRISIHRLLEVYGLE